VTTVLLRVVTAALIAVVAWVFIDTNTTMRKQIEQNEEAISQNARLIIQNTTLLAELRQINAQQDQLIGILTSRIEDHEARIRAVEQWRANLNRPQ